MAYEKNTHGYNLIMQLDGAITAVIFWIFRLFA